LKANADGSAAIQVGGSDAITITSGLAVSMNGGAVYPLVSGTAVASTSGTSIDFTSIPSTVKRITILLNGVSTNGTSIWGVRIGSGSFDTSGYLGSVGATRSGSSANANYSTSFALVDGNAAVLVLYGSVTLTLINSNTWVFAGTTGRTDTSGSYFYGGVKALSGALDRVQVMTVNGTDTFDAGTINILWE
jgi:hypothetical protein